jgi:hypothetical protein
MDQPVTGFTPSAGWRLRVAAARLQRRIGSAGVIGLLALGAGLLVGWDAWSRHQRFAEDAASLHAEQPSAPPSGAAASAPPVRVRWPSASEVPVLLSRLERAAVQEGLGWPQADYRVTPATGDTPASLEVRCTLKGPYPAIRRFITVSLLDQPTLTLREFAVTRANSEASNVDAKLTLVVYLAGSGSEVKP